MKFFSTGKKLILVFILSMSFFVANYVHTAPTSDQIWGKIGRIIKKDNITEEDVSRIAELTHLLASIEYHSPPTTIIQRGSGVETVKYIIFHDNETPKNYYAKNGDTGEIEFSSTNATAVIQAAMNALTSGRTWKETILLRGDFEINSTIPLTSYTRIVIDGVLRLASGASANMFEAVGTSSAHLEEIEVEGGIVHGMNIAGDLIGIYLEYVDDFRIHNVEFRNWTGMGILTNRSYDFEIFDNKFIDCELGAKIYFSNRWTFLGNAGYAPSSEPYASLVYADVVEHYVIDGNEFKGSDIIIHVATSKRGVISNNIVSEGRGGGIAVTEDNWYVVVIGNMVHDMSKEGIECRKIHEGAVIGNVLYNNGYEGLRLWNLYDTVISGNTLIDNGYVVGLEHPWYSQLTIYQEDGHILTHDVLIIGNRFVNKDRTPDYQIMISNMTGHTTLPGENYIRHNLLDGASVEVIHIEGPSVAEDNIGYTTENSGMAIVANNEWVAHSLVTTPSLVTLTPMNATYLGQPVVVSWTDSNSTHFQVGTYFANGTAIVDDVIGISWYAEA